MTATKHLRFCNEVNTLEPSVILSEDDVQSMWYTDDEVLQIIVEAQSIVTLMKRTPYYRDTETITSRGLERFILNSPDYVEKVVHEVLEEQQRQRREGFRDEDSIRNVLTRYSTYRQRIAHLRGVHDAQSVLPRHSTRLSLQEDSAPSSSFLEKHRLKRAKRRSTGVRMP